MNDDATDASAGPDSDVDASAGPDSDVDASAGPDSDVDASAGVDSDAGPDRGSVPDPLSNTESDGEPDPVQSIPDGPRNLHWLTVPYRVVQQGLGIVAAVFIIGGGSASRLIRSGDTLVAVGALVAILGGIGAVVGYFIAHYRRYEYELTADTFDIRSGVFSRREREIPLRRIQNVDISQDVVQRALGIAVVELETAGGGGTEAQLQYVDVDEADRLQSEISRLSRAADSGGDGTVESGAERFETVFAITERELGVLALVSMDLRIASVLFFGASLFAPSVAPAADPAVVYGPETFVRALYGPLAGIAVVLVLALLSGVLNAARYYGFTLDRGDEELRYERGLLQNYRGTIPISKVQSLTIRETVLARAWGYASLYIETAGHAAGGDQSGGSQSAVPLAKRDRVVELTQSLEDARVNSFARPPTRALLRYIVRYSLVLFGLSAALYLGARVTDYDLFWYVPLVGLLVVYPAAHLKWKHRGYAVGDDHVVTRNGFWVRKTKVVPFHRVQTVFSSETIFQRRRDLGTVTVDTAGSHSFSGDDARAVDVDVEDVEALRETVADGLYVSLRRRASERDDTDAASAVSGGTGAD